MKAASFLVLSLVCAQLAFGQLPTPAPQTSATPAPYTGPVPKGLRVFTVGHSFHAWVGPVLKQMAASAGIKDHVMVGVLSVGGSTVEQCWEVPNISGGKAGPPVNTAKNALTAGQVDVLTLSPIWMPDEGIQKFVDLGLQHNPNIRVTVQEFWMPNDMYKPVYPLEVHVNPPTNHNAATVEQLTKAYNAYAHDVEAYVSAINQKEGKPVVEIVPVGAAVNALRAKVIAGQAPGIATQAELFRDPWGHPSPVIQVLSGYVHYAVIYRTSPVGLPMPIELKGKYQNDALNRMLQEIAWQAAISNPMSGVTEANALK